MKFKGLIVFGIIFLITLVSATYYPSGLSSFASFPADIVLQIPFNLTATNLFGILNWSYLDNYPVACPSGYYLTQLGDSVVCSEISGNISVENITAEDITATRITLDKYGVSAYLNESATTTTTSADTWYPINGTFINEIIEGFWLNVTVPTDASIVYNGTETQYFDILWSATVSSDTPATTVHIAARDGEDPDDWVMATLCKTADEEYALSGIMAMNLSQGSRVQLVLESDQEGGVITMVHFTTKIRESFA